MNEENKIEKSYGFKVKVLGNEVLAIELSTTDDSNRWMVLGLVSVFTLITVLGAYGDKILVLYNYVVK